MRQWAAGVGVDQPTLGTAPSDASDHRPRSRTLKHPHRLQGALLLSLAREGDDPDRPESGRDSENWAPRSPQTDETTSGVSTVPTIRVDLAAWRRRGHVGARCGTTSPSRRRSALPTPTNPSSPPSRHGGARTTASPRRSPNTGALAATIGSVGRSTLRRVGLPNGARLWRVREGPRSGGQRLRLLGSRCRDRRSERLTAPLHSRGRAARSHHALRARVRSEGRGWRGMEPVRRALRVAPMRPRRRSRAECSWPRNACGGPR